MKTTIISYILGNKQSNMAKNFGWNMIGSLLFAASTIILTIVTTRIVGESLGGDFAIALSTAQLMASIGYYEVRTIQVTDINNQFTFSDYFFHRILTNLLMMACAVIFILIKGYGLEKGCLVIIICILKLLDTFADVYEGLFQKNERLDLSGKSLAIRTIASTFVFCAVLLFTKNMYIAAAMSIIIAIVCICIFNLWLKDHFISESVQFHKQRIWRLFIECFPLFAGTFMFSYVSNASRYAIDALLSANYVAYFTAIFLPVSTINLVSGFIFKPLLTTFANKWQSETTREFMVLMARFVLMIVGITLCAIVGGYFIGLPILSLLYGIDLEAYRWDLVILLLGGGFSAFSTIEYYCLAVMRAQKSIFSGYLFAFILSLIIPNILVSYAGVQGAAIGYLILMIAIVMFFFICIIRQFRLKQKGEA